MQQFIPFEDDWDALENLRPEDLIPYRVGLPLCRDATMASDSGLASQTWMDMRSGGPSGPLVCIGGRGN